ncbi:PTS system mannose/fructose/sorbose family transporter subunit IID, partial [Pseudomonas aeruginosa]
VTTARAMKGHMGFFNTHPFLVTFVIGIILAMERSKRTLTVFRAPKLPSVRRLAGLAMQCSG